MNWTGGGLSRSRYASNPMLAKQKNHFARIRNNLQTARPSTETITSNLGHWKPQLEIKRPSEADSSCQERLEQPRKRKRRTSQDVNTSAKTKRLKGDTKDPIIIGSSPSAPSIISRGSMKSKAERGSRENPDPLHTDLDMKRVRLLAKDDWMGLRDRHTAKPINIFVDPKDRDLIGKRRPIPKNDRSSQRYKRPQNSRVAAMQRTSVVPTAVFQYNSQEDPSVRIGSQVDRSEYSLKNKSVTGGERQRYAESDEILDTWKLSSPAQTVLGSGSSGTQMSRYKYQGAHTPSASIYDTSPSGALSPILEEIDRGYASSISPSRVSAVSKRNSSEDSYWNLKLPEYEPQQNPAKCRLVFEDTPRPVTSGREKYGSSAIIRDFAYLEPLTPNEAVDILSPAEDQMTEHPASPVSSEFVDMFEDSNTVAPMATAQDGAQPDMFQGSPTDAPVATSQGKAQSDGIKSTQAIADDEEKIWRQIIFGDEESTDCTVETSSQLRSTQDAPTQTQPSLIAEIDTSPIKQNPHLYSDVSSAYFMLPTSSPKQRSENYSPSSEGTIDSPEERPHQSNNVVDQSSSPSNSSLEVQATLPDTDDTPTRLPPVNTSQVVEASSSSPTLPSTDEISRPAQPTVGVSIRERIQSRVRDSKPVPQQDHSFHHNRIEFTPTKVFFKKPAPYIGSEPPKEEVLGGKIVGNGTSIGNRSMAKKERAFGATTERRRRGKLVRRKTRIDNRDGRVYNGDLELLQWTQFGDDIEDDSSD